MDSHRHPISKGKNNEHFYLIYFVHPLIFYYPGKILPSIEWKWKLFPIQSESNTYKMTIIEGEHFDSHQQFCCSLIFLLMSNKNRKRNNNHAILLLYLSLFFFQKFCFATLCIHLLFFFFFNSQKKCQHIKMSIANFGYQRQRCHLAYPIMQCLQF